MINVRYPVIDMTKTGANIQRLRKQKGYPVREVASFMGFENPVAIYKWERGIALPTVDHLYALSKLLGAPMEEILVEQ